MLFELDVFYVLIQYSEKFNLTYRKINALGSTIRNTMDNDALTDYYKQAYFPKTWLRYMKIWFFGILGWSRFIYRCNGTLTLAVFAEMYIAKERLRMWRGFSFSDALIWESVFRVISIITSAMSLVLKDLGVVVTDNNAQTCKLTVKHPDFCWWQN